MIWVIIEKWSNIPAVNKGLFFCSYSGPNDPASGFGDHTGQIDRYQPRKRGTSFRLTDLYVAIISTRNFQSEIECLVTTKDKCGHGAGRRALAIPLTFRGVSKLPGAPTPVKWPIILLI
jgi:hypothetical protein